MNQLRDILSTAGRFSSYDNRSYYCKAVNDILAGGMVTIKICEAGKHWPAEGVKNGYNLKVVAAGRKMQAYIRGTMQPSEILTIIGKLLQTEIVKAAITSAVELHENCSRCSGRGFIPQFSHFCNGICFDCCGTGKSKEKTVVKIY